MYHKVEGIIAEINNKKHEGEEENRNIREKILEGIQDMKNVKVMDGGKFILDLYEKIVYIIAK